MEDLTEIGRPYAKAVFEFALEKKQIQAWHDFLFNAALMVEDSEVKKLLNNPNVTSEQLLSLFEDVLKTEESQNNFLKLLEEYHRLNALPAIVKGYENLLDEYHDEQNVFVTTAFILKKEQEQKLIAALEKRFNKKIKLHCKEDKSILGGAILRVNDLVIDYSGKTQLSRLADYLKGKELCN